MQYKNILVYLDNGASNAERVNTAVAIAKFHQAELTGVVVSALPTQRMMHNLGMDSDDDSIKRNREMAEGILQDFAREMIEKDVKHNTRIIEFRESHVAQKLARLARNFDLCILRQANPGNPNADFISDLSEGVLFYSGRPVFFMPYIGAHAIPCRKGIIAWDGSAAATRAVHDALPLLEQMEEVVILVVNADKLEKNTDCEPGEDLSRHLTAHGVTNRIQYTLSGEISTSTVILNEVSNYGADIIIMGGYGTSRLREMVLGGVTHSLFTSMTVPVFMSH